MKSDKIDVRNANRKIMEEMKAKNKWNNDMEDYKNAGMDLRKYLKKYGEPKETTSRRLEAIDDSNIPDSVDWRT